MAEVSPGSAQYRHSDRVPAVSQNGTGERGDAVAFGSDGGVVHTTGENGFAGVLGMSPENEGDQVPMQVQGIVRANVAAGVSPGEALVPGSSGQLDGTGTPAGPGDVQAWSEADDDGYALVRLP